MPILILLVALLQSAPGQPVELPTLFLPASDGAWVVRIVTTGGLTGRGIGSVTANSAGDLLCTSATCPRLVPGTRRALTDIVAAMTQWGQAAGADAATPILLPGRSSTCSDCVTTTMTVRRRAADGERTVIYRWDVSTSAGVPDDARRLHAAVLAIDAR